MSEITEIEQTLDEAFVVGKKEEPFRELVRWWEKKRLIYNGILIGLITIAILLEHDSSRYADLSFQIAFALIFVLIANLFFCLGWGFPILLNHYFGAPTHNLPTRWVLFVLGTGFTVLVSWLFFAGL